MGRTYKTFVIMFLSILLISQPFVDSYVVVDAKNKNNTEVIDIEKTGAVRLSLTDEEGSEVVGAKYDLYKEITEEEKQENLGKTHTLELVSKNTRDTRLIEVYSIEEDLETDIFGEVYIDDLSFGKYHFVNTGVPEGFETEDTPISFEINKEASIEKTNDQLVLHGEVKHLEKVVVRDSKEIEEERIKDEVSQGEGNDERLAGGPSFPIVPFVGDLRTDIAIEPYTKDVLSGRTAMYLLTLKTTGPRHRYKNAKLTVQLPDLNKDFLSFDESQLDKLKIAGVEPTYDPDKYKLTYDFGDDLKVGQTYEVIIPLKTENGITPNGTELEATARLEAFIEDDYSGQTETFDESDSATVTVNASAEIVVTKTLQRATRTIDGEVQNVPFPILGGATFWKIKVSIPKKPYGQIYLDPQKKIEITDRFTDGLLFPSNLNNLVVKGPEYTSINQNKNEIYWEIDTPSLAEQKNAKTYLYQEEIEIRLRVPVAKSYVGETITNNVTIDTFTIDQDKLSESDQASARIYDTPSDTGEIEGNIAHTAFYGPKDGKGNTAVQDVDDRDPNPLVYDHERLGWSHGTSSHYHLQYVGIDESKDQEYRTEFKIDNNLYFEELTTPGRFRYRPTSAFNGTNIALPFQPEYDIKIKIKGDADFRTAVRNADHGTPYTRADLGLSPNEHVEEIRLVFTKAPAGMFADDKAYYYFTPKDGYEGIVINEFDIYIKSQEGRERYTAEKGERQTKIQNTYRYSTYSQRVEDNGGSNTYKRIAGPTRATVVGTDNKLKRIGRVAISFLDSNKGIVTPGDNTVEMFFHNQSTSTTHVQGPVDGVALLPKGVTLKENPHVRYYHGPNLRPIDGEFTVLDENYNGTGQQLIKVTWIDPGSNNQLAINNAYRAHLDVDIAPDAPKELYFDIWGFTKDRMIQAPSTSGDTITNTTLEKDIDDLNNNGNSEEDRLKSGNLYNLKESYDLISDKKVRTTHEDYTDWNMLSKGVPGETVDYKLTLNNMYGEDIKRLTLIDVLPSIGDRAITNPAEERNTMFEPYLTGPIELDSKFEIKYTTTKDPKRKPLVDETKYPGTTEELDPNAGDTTEWINSSEVTDWSDIYAFKIELKEGEILEADEIHEIIFTMQLPNICDVDFSVFDTNKANHERAAFNSFAVSTEHGQAVEPLRVGVYLDATGAVELKKVDEEGEPLAGATFELKNSDGNVVATETTDEDGLIQIDGLEYGNYYFVETKAPEGYVKNEKEHEVIVASPYDIDLEAEEQCGEMDSITVVNEKEEDPTGAVELKKVDGVKDNPLEGVVFELYKNFEDDELIDEFIDEFTTDGEGKIQKDGLEYGKYYFLEKSTIEGYAKDNTKYKFIIEEEGSFNEDDKHIGTVVTEGLTVENYETPKIEKDVAESSKAKGGEYLAVDRDREYVYNLTITAPGDVKDYKVLGVWDKLDDRLTFVHGIDDETKKPLSSLGKNGWVVSSSTESAYEVTEDDIEFGTRDDGTLTWNVKEDSIKKLTPGQEITITFTAKINPDAELEPEKDGIPNQAEIEFDNNKGEENDPGDNPKVPPTPPVIVEPSEGGLELLKVDGEDHEKVLPGAEFKLVHAETDKGLNVEKGQAVQAAGTIIRVNGSNWTEDTLVNLITDDDGKITIEGLTPGKYELIETKAPTFIDEDNKKQEYRLLTKPIEIMIEENQQENLKITVKNNKPGWELPETGGLGTVLYYLIGFFLMLISLTIVSKRRLSS